MLTVDPSVLSVIAVVNTILSGLLVIASGVTLLKKKHIAQFIPMGFSVGLALELLFFGFGWVAALKGFAFAISAWAVWNGK